MPPTSEPSSDHVHFLTIVLFSSGDSERLQTVDPTSINDAHDLTPMGIKTVLTRAHELASHIAPDELIACVCSPRACAVHTAKIILDTFVERGIPMTGIRDSESDSSGYTEYFYPRPLLADTPYTGLRSQSPDGRLYEIIKTCVLQYAGELVRRGPPLRRRFIVVTHAELLHLPVRVYTGSSAYVLPPGSFLELTLHNGLRIVRVSPALPRARRGADRDINRTYTKMLAR